MSDGPLWQFAGTSTTLMVKHANSIMKGIFVATHVSYPCTVSTASTAACYNFSLSPRIFESETLLNTAGQAYLQNTATLPVQISLKLDEIKNK